MLIKYTEKERDLLARLMRAEAIGEGKLGMLMVGNVVVNRVLANCYIFKNINTLYNAIYQDPGGFSGKDSSLFYNRATEAEKKLADRVLKGEYFYPATNSLWFYAPKDQSCSKTWYEQSLAGRYKSHCFYKPSEGVCPQLY